MYEKTKNNVDMLYSRVIYYFLIAFLLIPFASRGQVKVNFNGSIKDKRQNGLPYASIGVYKNSVIIKGVICDSTGNFSMLLPIGKYTIRASSVMFDDYVSELNISKDTSINIILNGSSKQLSEVTVTAQKPLIEHKIDRIVFNVENSIFKHGVDAFELLRQTPRIEIMSDDGIKMIGKDGLRIMIDGRILNLSEEDVKQKLKSLRSDNIAKIEVIAIPPAKYSAEGNSGLVNIVLKKNPLLGWQGFINASYIQRVYPSFSQSGTVNYKSKKVEASVSVNNDHSKIENIQNLSFTFTDKILNTDKYLKGTQNTATINSVLKYKPTNRMEVGATFDYSIQKGKNNVSERSLYIHKIDNSIDSTVNSFSFYKNQPQAIAFSTYYDYNMDSSGKKMSLTYNYSLNTDRSTKDVTSEITDLTQKIKSFVYYGDNNYSINSIMADFELPYHFAMVETGGGYTNISNKTGLKLYNNISNQLVLDSTITNDFEYSEKTSALYLSANKDFNKKWSGKIGLRYEYTYLEGNSPTLRLINHNNYGNLFPSIFILYNQNEQNSFSLAYSKRIDRPGFNDLNPFRYYSSVYSYVSGNPYLLPSFTHNVDFSYSFKNNLSIILSYTRFLDGIDYVTLFSTDGTNRVVPENHFNQNRIGFNVSYSYKPYKWWNIYTNCNLFYSQSKSYKPELQIPNTEGIGGSIMSSNSFTLNKKNTTFWQINYYHFLPSENGFNHTKGFGYFSANLRFVALNRKMQFMISALDIFKQNFSITERQYSNYSSKQTFNARLQNFRLSVNYTFGNKKVSGVNRESKNIDKYRAM